MDIGVALTYISLIVVLVVVLALVIYLLAIIAALRGANKNLYQLAGGLDQIVKDTAPLPGKMTTINGALGQLLSTLIAVDGHLQGVLKVFGR